MTTEEFLALPEDDGIDRELINGVLREKPMPTRGKRHCRVTLKLSYLLYKWLRDQPKPWGAFYVGDIRIRLTRSPVTFVGADIAYVSAEQEALAGAESRFVDGPPLLAIEIASPSDTVDDIDEKIDNYLDAGVVVVWQIYPRKRTVEVHRRGLPVKRYDVSEEFSGEPELPGFKIQVAEIFED